MEFIRINENFSGFDELFKLQAAYKLEIGENAPSDIELQRLKLAIREGVILFYGCVADGKVVALCSVSKTFSTFDYNACGVFEDFYILPEYRHKGIARRLCAYAFEQSGVTSMTVGCASCDLDMYNAIGFNIPLGNMLAYDKGE